MQIGKKTKGKERKRTTDGKRTTNEKRKRTTNKKRKERKRIKELQLSVRCWNKEKKSKFNEKE